MEPLVDLALIFLLRVAEVSIGTVTIVILGYAVTVLAGGPFGDVMRVSLVVVPRRTLKNVYREIARLNPGALVTIESTTQVDLAAAPLKTVIK